MYILIECWALMHGALWYVSPMLTCQMQLCIDAWCVAVCEYYAHLDCQDFVVSDCKECSTYQPQREKVRGSVQFILVICCVWDL